MKRNLLFSFFLATISSLSLHAEEAKLAESAPTDALIEEGDLEDKEALQISVISEAFGHLIAKHIVSLGVNFDMASIVKGLQDADAGKVSPLPEAECIEAIAKTREAAFKEQASANLQKAEKFMEETLKQADVVALEKGKLHYHVDAKGEGAVVEGSSKPLIRYIGKFIDGTIFGASKEEDTVILEETIPGFGKGLLGMKEGEKRTLYIHPDLAYGTMGQLPPNSLLIFEVDLVKANAEPAANEQTAANEPEKKEQATAPK
jgi:peptidylprolyl isomerase